MTVGALAVALLLAVGTGATLAGASISHAPLLVAPSCTPDPHHHYPKEGFISTLPRSVGPIHAPPLTKMGFTTNLRGKYTWMCSAGTSQSINAYLNQQMRNHGYRYSSPPASVNRACNATGLSWWKPNGKGHVLFSWHFQRTAGAHGEFWTYYSCVV
jgi:hypothetical protein